MENSSIREVIRKSGVFQWQVAEALGISEATLTRWLRKPVSAERQAVILSAIDSVKLMEEA